MCMYVPLLDDFFISSDYFRINKLDIIYHYHQWAPMTIQCTARVWVLVELVQENLSDMQRSSCSSWTSSWRLTTACFWRIIAFWALLLWKGLTCFSSPTAWQMSIPSSRSFAVGDKSACASADASLVIMRRITATFRIPQLVFAAHCKHWCNRLHRNVWGETDLLLCLTSVAATDVEVNEKKVVMATLLVAKVCFVGDGVCVLHHLFVVAWCFLFLFLEWKWKFIPFHLW